MRIYVHSKIDKGFVFEFLPTFIYKKWLSSINKNRVKIEKVLKENNISLKQFTEGLKKIFTVKQFGNYYILSVKNNSIDTIMRIIDYGNTSTPPQHIFDKDFNYAKENLSPLCNMWLRYIPI